MRTKLNSLLLALALLVGCGNDQPEEVGTATLELVTGGQTLNQVDYVVKQGAPTIASGSIDVSGASANIKPSVTLKLPVGTGYTVQLTGTTTTSVPCTGTSSSFTIAQGMPTTVNLTLFCTQTTGETKGTAKVSATVSTNSCPVIGEAWMASPTTQQTGGWVTITGLTATDADMAQTLTYAWTTVGVTGTFGAPATLGSGGFQCTAVSSGQLRLAVTDNATTPCTSVLLIDVACVM